MFSLEKNNKGNNQAVSNYRETLKNDFFKKTFLEKYFSEFQTKEMPLRGAENPEQTRGEYFRFERGQILKAYQILRAQISEDEENSEEWKEKKDFLEEIRLQANVWKKKLDELERQYYENGKIIDIDTKFGKFSAPVVELDLRSQEEKEKQENEQRPPYFILGSVAQNYHQMAAFASGLALNGERVLVPTWPEQAASRPDNFGELLKKQGDLEIHKEYAKKIIQALGLEKINLVGYSMGGAVSLQLAQDENFSGIQDLIVVEPAGLENKGFLKLGKDFAFEEGVIKTMPYSVNRIKTVNQGKREEVLNMGFLLEDCKILSKKCFDTETLSRIMPQGRYQLWAGTKSSIINSELATKIFLEVEKSRQESDPTASPVEINIVKGGSHGWPLVHNMGFSREIKEEKSSEDQVKQVELADLETSVMAKILKEIK